METESVLFAQRHRIAAQSSAIQTTGTSGDTHTPYTYVSGQALVLPIFLDFKQGERFAIGRDIFGVGAAHRGVSRALVAFGWPCKTF
jgi:hypothetical protein